MNNLKNKERIEKRADFYREDIENIATWLYEHPEIALQEFESSKMLSQYMRKQGFEVIEELAGMKTAWKATKKNGTKGPKVCFMAEYDALPVGHACGHHMIAAMSVGAACVLADILQDYEGEVTVVGTPAEETGDGKTYLADQHVFDDYDLALSLHPCYQTIVCPNMIAIGGKDFKFTGKAAHAGANPYDGVNALDATILFFNNINALRQQIKDGTRIHGIIVEAGKAANIIPASTGAAVAVGKVLPNLLGKLDGMAFRVPVTDGSVVDLTVELKKNVTVEEVNEALKNATNETLGFTMDPIVSSDIIGSHYGSLVDGLCTTLIEVDGKQMVKVVAWYDNEMSYSTQMVRTAKLLGTML